MKTYLLVCFFLCFAFAFSQTERDIIHKIDSINSSAQLHFNNDEIVESFKVFNLANKLSDSINDSYGKAISNFNLGKIYTMMQELGHAENCYKIMLEEAKKINEDYLIAQAFFRLGEIKIIEKSSVQAISYLENALKYISKCNSKTDDIHNEIKCQNILLDIRMKLSEFYLKTGEVDKALVNLLRVEEKIKNKTDNNSLYLKGFCNYLYGIYYVNIQLYNTAIEKFESATIHLNSNGITNNYESDLVLSKVYKELSLAFEKADKREDAYFALINYNKHKEKLINEAKSNNEIITRTKLLIEGYKNDAEIAIAEQFHQKQVANSIKTINLIVVCALIFLVFSLITLYKGYASKRKLTKVLSKQNKELEIARKAAEKSSELKSKFISNVTHELRTPLYGVVGITSLLLEKNNLNTKDSKLISSLKYSGDYLLNLVNDVLQFGKMESQTLELKNVSVNLRELIKNNSNSFSFRLQETNNKLEVLIDDDVPEFIKCDSVRLSQVIINLLGNSIKFTESGRIKIRVKTLKLSNEKAYLRFEVEDNGVGIPKEKFKTIFDNFSQLDDNININYQGTGLGLSITKRIVELFGSQIELESEEGVGSTFSFNVSFDIDNTIKKTDINKSKAGVKIVDLKNRFRILVAEDNKINQIVTKNLLSKNNYGCKIVENGSDALKAVKENSFDLILMDINMPLMNGVDATKLIREFDTNIPIIALTAADIDHVKENYDDIGFNGILTKPFDNIEFFQMIDSEIELSKNFSKTLEKVS
ncbi:ATP-binding protein [Algibacter aquimarinus]|uniref:histidine kinase n=1 Tax=Algibacter aquimarinus TaxID=1136748 RepID=A0ABP9H7T1_9FLAO